MYWTVEPPLRMTTNEASAHYPDHYIIMRMDSMRSSSGMGTVLYIGDDGDELFSLVMRLDDPSLCGVIDGLNHGRSLGGIVVGT